jgi:phage terminase small subunit
MFCREYVKDLNGTHAAIRAGYSPKNRVKPLHRLTSLSENSGAHCCPSGRAAEARRGGQRPRPAARLVEETDAHAGDLFDDAGQLKPVKEWPLACRRGFVSSIKITKLNAG